MNTCGRPFLVEGVGLRAKVVSRGDWRAEANATIDDLDVNVRRVLGEHWVEMARMEHASIAAFARFTLQLLSLGAPAELLQASQRALADEVEHARLCFGVAGRYLGADVGPGPLPIDGALADLEVVSVFRATFFEACVEETCSALEVAEAAERATDPTLRAVLSRIAEDEARHGELGWSTTQWLLRAVPSDRRAALHSELRDHVMAALRDAQRQSTTTSLDDRVVAHGMLQASTRRALRLAALADVVLPCLSRLFDGVGTSAAA
jgi:hypothetical protein